LIEPAPDRGRRIHWSVFLKAHWKSRAPSDFFSVEVWSWKGLVTHYVLFVIALATREVAICGITTNPNEEWTLQVARNLIDSGTAVDITTSGRSSKSGIEHSPNPTSRIRGVAEG
jgi:hypothetical protein